MDERRGMVRASRDPAFRGTSREISRGTDDGLEVHGVEEARDGLLKFLNESVGSVKIDTIIVQLFQTLQSGEPIQHFPFNASDSIEQLTDDILQIAEQDIADSRAHKISYSVKLAQHNGRKSFALTTSSNDDEAAGSGMEMNGGEMIPTLRHITTQQMSHNQVLVEVAVGSLGGQLKRMGKENDRLVARVQYLEAERERYYESREAILSFQHERDMELKKQEKKDFYMGQIVSTGMNAVAPLINKYAKQMLVPQKATPLEGMMIALASTIGPEQVEKLISSGVFTSPQLQNFMQIVESIHKAFEEEKKGQAPPPPGQVPPSPHPAGQANGAG